MRKFLISINVLFVVGLLASYASAYISPENAWYFAFFGLTYAFWVICNLLFVLIWVIIKMKLALISLIALLIGFPIHMRFSAFRFLPAQEQELSENQIKLMTYNVQLFGLYNWKDNIKHRNEMFRFLRKEDPDIACFQEYFYEETDYFETTDTLVKILDANYVHFESASSLHETHHWGAATFSRFPIVRRSKIKFERSRGNICLVTDIVKGGDTLRIFNVHFESNHLETAKIDRLADGDSTARIIATDMFRALRKSYKRRASQVDLVSKAIKESPYPVVVCGDFNDTPVSYTYSEIASGLKDAYLESGRGLGFTYAGKIPFLRIDYILHDERIKTTGFRVLNAKKYSDHYPLECVLEISGADSAKVN